ncbi:hypothetical protein CWB96_10890 [Pseudoalteromonas citrea]|uniref:Prepilin-type cleavage/methylation domain-containing protein n=1 Tax=Pseudoalteromonas citrea TaxID=43655 RepID=A0A5S3XPB0_9GAMM|nr:prepilin-type N-terminal cleavage/methylation domain-containing protein [Pseudoalteromonas citrea]TMP45682.1 hypothetical protein CWB97_03535 [Pseudoalteromonas citrea]TMP59061.1 hypothetical protein CWB96_10890 [Pseudoalteromonas citrea]
MLVLRVNFKGFTLIELMIVMAVTAMLISFVGPFAIKNYERVQIKEEQLALVNWVDAQSYRSFALGRKGVFNFSHNDVTFVLESKVDDTQPFSDEIQIQIPSYKKSFKYLAFQPQQLKVNAFGFLINSSIAIEVSGKVQTLTLFKEASEE